MSKVMGFIVGAITIAAGIITGNPALIIQGAAMIVTQGVVLLTAPKAPARQASEMTIQLGEQPRSALFGECFTAGSLVDAFNYGGKYGTDWEVLVIRLADHRCHSLTGFYVNDKYVAYTGDGNYSQFQNGSRQQLLLYFRADTSTEPLPSLLTVNGPGWSPSDLGQGGCDVIVFYRADKPDAKKPVWPGGRPRFGFVVKGKLCYDPRLDSTVGGSGGHRWDNPATWEWSENAAVCRYNWVRGIYANDQVDDQTQLLVGRGLSEAEAPPSNIFAAANLCDETVDGAPRYRVAGPVYADQTCLEVEEMFAKATGGSVVTHQGSVELEPGAAKSVVAVFTDDDLVVGSKVSWNGAVLSDSDSGWINTVVANYVEPTQKWNQHDAPVVRDENDILSDGGPRETQLSLRLVKWVGQAQRVAEIYRRLGRLWGRAQVTLGPRFCEIEEGDWVQWQSQRRFGGLTRTFRVEAYSIDEKWQNTLTLREISASVFGDEAEFSPDYSVVTVVDPPPDVGAPDSGQWALAAITMTSAGITSPALEVTGDAGDDETAEALRFEYWKSDGVINPITDPDDPTWATAGTYPPETTKVDITGVEGNSEYYVAVTYVVSGEPGDRLVLGPVTTADMDVSGAVQPLINEAITGLSWKTAVRARTTAALPANTYANGSSGVGATLTANSNGAITAQDGVTLAVNERLLVANEAAAAHNGIYKVTQVGDASTPYILTRATDADSSAELVNATVYVSEGAGFEDSQWTCTTNAPIVVGTTGLAFGQSGSGAVSVEDDGAPQGSATTFDFVGAGVSVSVAGGVATVNVPGGGSGAWQLVDQSGIPTAASATWTWSSNVANVDVAGLGVYNELLIIARGVGATVSGFRAILFSVNNGSSYFSASGDYVAVNSTGVEGPTTGLSHATAATAARTLELHTSNTKGALKHVTTTAGRYIFAGSASDINALRLLNINGGNLTSGALYVFAR